MKVPCFLSRLLADATGTSTVEMGLICAMIILAMMGALRGFADVSVGTWETVAAKTSTAIHGSSS